MREGCRLLFHTQCCEQHLVHRKLSEKICCMRLDYGYKVILQTHLFPIDPCFSHSSCQSSTSPDPLLGLPLHLPQQEPDPLSTCMFPNSDNQPSPPCMPPNNLGFPFTEEQKTAAWGRVEPVHLTPAHGQRNASRAASVITVSEDELVKAISRCSIKCTALNSL